MSMNRPIVQLASMVNIGRSGETFCLLFRPDTNAWEMDEAITSWKARFDLTDQEGAFLHAQCVNNRNEAVEINRQYAEKMNGFTP